MPKLPVVTPLKLIKIFEKAGFVWVHGAGSHRVYKNSDGARIVIPVHGRDIPNGTLLAILKDANISKEEFVKLLQK
jgi:mRNA interferase HicA